MYRPKSSRCAIFINLPGTACTGISEQQNAVRVSCINSSYCESLSWRNSMQVDEHKKELESGNAEPYA